MTVRRWFARWGDLALAVVLLLVLVVELAGHDGTPPTAYAAALLCAAPLALRRRLPVVACLLAIVGMAAISLLVSSFMNTSFGMIAVLAIALYSMGRYARGVEAGIAAGVVLVVIVAFLASEQQASTSPGTSHSPCCSSAVHGPRASSSGSGPTGCGISTTATPSW